MSKHRSGSKKVPPDIGLHMECTEEELEPSQKDYYAKAEKEYNEVQAKLNNYIKKMKAEVIEKGENCFVLQLNAVPQNVSPSNSANGKRQATQNFTPIVGQQILTRSAANGTGNTYLVMDPRLGLVVGQMPAVSTEQSTTTVASKSVVTTRGRSVTVSPTATTPVTVTTRARSGGKKGGTSIETEAPLTRTREKSRNQSLSPQSGIVQQAVFASTVPAVTKTYRIKVNAKQQPPPLKPSENNAIGGLSVGSDAALKPTADDSSKVNAADSREVTFNKLSGKTFPSLVVVARPHLRLKYIAQSNITQERTALDARVKGVLMYTPTKFTEWLIQQGLIRSEQFCPTHVNNDLSPVSLKLGMYSDVSKFTYSGGYVWISECCPSQFVSVFSGSIFEGAPHPPTTLLKLIYHWACQTNVQNVVQWVKVDNLYVKNFFTNMRAVCTQAIHQKYQKIGGPKKRVEVGVISLGTTSQDGNMRQVKVEVLAVMDPESKQIRLRAVEPLSEERHFRKRFIKILEPLEEWVHKESEILTDFTVDKGTLHCMGFHTVYQVSITDPPSKYSNQNVMEYLRRIVPRMFQNTLSLLSRQIIQQFLDELVWREMWGPIASQAFNNIIAHLAEQTKLDVVDNLLTRLNKVSSNPFKNWNYSVWKPITASFSNTKAIQAPAVPIPAVSPATVATATVTNLETIPLALRLQSEIGQSSIESPEGDSPAKNIRTRKRTAEQGNLFEFTPPLPVKKVPKILQRAQVKKDEKRKSGDKSLELAEKLPEEIINYINETVNQIPIESYYYGTRQPDEEIPGYDGRFAVKCCVCYKIFTDNIILMRHMILHCQTEPQLIVDLKKVCQCNYCFLGFNNNNALKVHLEEVHFVIHNKVEHDYDCQICEEKFEDRVNLVYHMQKTHVEMELPYECGVCKFRTSFYKQFIDHFSQAHKGSPFIFCPFCLKVVTVAHDGETITSNTIFYISHLERHQRKSLAKKCHRCQLSFIHKGILDQHLEADHCGFKFDYGVKPVEITDESISMPEPNAAVIKLSTPPSGKLMKSRLKNPFVTNKFKVLEIYGVEDDMECVECEGSISRREHFAGVMNCTKCRYTTCCEIAMVEHVTIFHDNLASQFTMGKPIILPQEMFCICGYSSSSGNRLAKHIAICEKKSAYPSEDAALIALALRQTEKDKLREKQEQAGEGQNVLSMLGLFKKSPERKEEAEDVEIEELKFVDKVDVSEESCNSEPTAVEEDKLDKAEEHSAEDDRIEDKTIESKCVEDKSVEDKSVEDKSVEDKSIEQGTKDNEEKRESENKEAAMEVDSCKEVEEDKEDTEMEVETVEEAKEPQEEQQPNAPPEIKTCENMETEECKAEEEAMEVDEDPTEEDRESSVVAEEKSEVEDKTESESLGIDEPNAAVEDKVEEEKPESIADGEKTDGSEEKGVVVEEKEKDEIENVVDIENTEKCEEGSGSVPEKEDGMTESSNDDGEVERNKEANAAVPDEIGTRKEVVEEVNNLASAENEAQENEQESVEESKQDEEVEEVADEQKDDSKLEDDVMDTEKDEKDEVFQGEKVNDDKKEEEHQEIAEEAVEAQNIEEAIAQNETNEANEFKNDEAKSALAETETPDIETNLDNLRNEEIESQEATIDENVINENIENDQIQEAARMTDTNEEIRDVGGDSTPDVPVPNEAGASVSSDVTNIPVPDVVGCNEDVPVPEALDQAEKGD